jgi:hypothetical protein
MNDQNENEKGFFGRMGDKIKGKAASNFMGNIDGLVTMLSSLGLDLNKMVYNIYQLLQQKVAEEQKKIAELFPDCIVLISGDSLNEQGNLMVNFMIIDKDQNISFHLSHDIDLNADVQKFDLKKHFEETKKQAENEHTK